ncbi:hypothetical protein HYZ98_02755 [Candidatus Peregrinibacteria bacterium]|nr:hypothetical protein [Candidatus Peregrinibacteria bacterium]
MEAQFELHRTDGRLFSEGEGEQILAHAITRTGYPMVLGGVRQSNGSVIGNIRLIGGSRYYRLQLVLTELQKVPNIRCQYGGSQN